MPNTPSFFQYVKAAFSWHWNLLAVGAGLALGLLSGRPDVVLPLLGAIEIAYLGLLSTHPRFRAGVEASQREDHGAAETTAQLQRIMSSLPPKEVKRFQMLRSRCDGLNRLGRELKGSAADEPSDVSNLHVASLDRLLWTFLKLLYSRTALDTFLRTTDRAALVRDRDQTRQEVEQFKKAGRKEALIRTLEDKLKTIEARLTNYDAATENSELIEAELERIEQKISAISEMSVSQTDPSGLSAQVDGITESLAITTEAIKTLEVIPEIQVDDEAPRFLNVKSG